MLQVVRAFFCQASGIVHRVRSVFTHGLTLQADLFQLLPDGVLMEVFKSFAWNQAGNFDKISLSDGSRAEILAVLCLTCRRFRKLITEGSPLWSRLELTGVERSWKTLQHQQSFLRWLHPKQASIRELQVMTTPRSVLHGADNVIALLNGVAPHLRAVGIQAVLPAASMAALGQCRELVELHLDCELDFDLSVLSELRKLQRVVTFLPGMIPEDFPKGGQSLMPWLTSLPKLRELALQGVPRDFHTWVHRLTGLKDLKLQGYTSNTGFGTGVLQHGLSQLVCLTSLHVEGSEYLTIGDADTVMHAVARLGSLHRLTLANCTVVQEEAWCPSLARLSHTLTYLDLHEIWGLRNPMQLSSLVRLRCLHFSKPDIPGIAGIPAGFRSDVNAWSGVERLTLQNCDFTIWPKGLAFLQHLRHLDLSKNRLMAISAQLSRLTALSELILQGIDDLTVASSVVCSFAQLNLLDVRDCEPVVLEGSLPQLVRHVPVFLFTCIRTPAEQRKLGQPATWW